jgi:glycerol-3-phosphate dehydrogenase
MASTAFRLRRIGAIITFAGATLAATATAASAQSYGGDGAALEAARRRIADPTAAVPRRSVQEAALAGTSPVNPLDVLVIGGGATGCGVALDAATRGLRVGLVERDDFSSGTSSRSTKLIHGGQCL